MEPSDPQIVGSLLNKNHEATVMAASGLGAVIKQGTLQKKVLRVTCFWVFVLDERQRKKSLFLLISRMRIPFVAQFYRCLAFISDRTVKKSDFFGS